MLGAGDLVDRVGRRAGHRAPHDIRKPASCSARSTCRWRTTRTASSTGSAARPRRRRSSTAEQLEKLHDLVQQGALTPASTRPRRPKLLGDREPRAAGRQPRPVGHRDAAGVGASGRWPAPGSASSPTCRRSAAPRTRTSPAIVGLAPDLVVMCDEENRREDADALGGRRPRGAQLLAPLGRRRRPGARRRSPRRSARPRPAAAAPRDTRAARRCGRSCRSGAGRGCRSAPTPTARRCSPRSASTTCCADAAGPLPGGRCSTTCGRGARRRPRPHRAVPVRAAAPRRARARSRRPCSSTARTCSGGACGRRRPSPASHRVRSACGAEDAGAGRRLDPPPLGERTAVA